MRTRLLERPVASRPTKVKARRAWRSVALLALLLTSFVPNLPAQAARSPGLEITGFLPEPKGGQFGMVSQVDPQGRRLYYTYLAQKNGAPAWRLRVYDLKPQLPRLLREAELGPFEVLSASSTPYKSALDRRNNRMLLLATTVDPPASLIRIIDLDSLSIVGTWDLSRQLPGFAASGLTYSAADDRIYLVGLMEGFYRSTATPLTFTGSRPAGTVPTAVALDASTGSMVWARSVTDCPDPLDTLGVGSLIARSRKNDALYFFCAPGGRTGAFGGSLAGTYPLQPGLVRIGITPDADAQDALDFPVDYFPVSGSYFEPNIGTGFAGFDPASDRFFAQSLSKRTPGTWVFDGRLGAWVGFIAAPDNKNTSLGVDSSTGHFYMGSSSGGCFEEECRGYLLTSDSRQTPVAQGELFDLNVLGFIAVDPGKRQLFFRSGSPDPKLSGRLLIVRDRTPTSNGSGPLDYDSLTMDVEESADTITTFSGGTNGYGVRLHSVGGYGGALSFYNQAPSIAQVRDGDKALTTARIPLIDLRDVGAAAASQSVVTDTNTDAEREGAGQPWPWVPASCLDGGGQPVSQDAPEAHGGTAHAECDLEAASAAASSTFGSVGSGPLAVASSAMQSKAFRDENKGIITETTAVARGISLSIPQAGSLSIGRVTTTASTVAKGRPGTTSASWTRTVESIAVVDASGKSIFESPGCKSTARTDTCAPIASAVEEALGTKVRVEFPLPLVEASKKGAFAGVGQTDADFYEGRTLFNQGSAFSGESESRAMPGMQLTVFNDSAEKSRLVGQFAAIQANSIYTISEAPTFDLNPVPQPPISEVPGVSAPSTSLPTSGSASLPDLGGESLDTTTPAPTEGPVLTTEIPVAGPPPEGLAFLVRSRMDALMFGFVWLLFGGAAFGIFRRQLLLRTVGGGRN